MSILIGFLIVVEALVCILLILIVLMQRPRQEGIGATFGAGMMDSLAGSQTTNVLQKGTTYLGTALFLLTFALAWAVSHQQSQQKKSFVDPTDKPIPAAPANATLPPGLSIPGLPPGPAAAPENKPPVPATPAPVTPSAAPQPEAKPVTPAPSPAPSPKPVVPTPPPANVIPVPTAPPIPPPVPSPAPPAATPEPAKPTGGN